MRKSNWLPFSILALLAAQVVIWLMILKATQDRIQAETRAKLPVIIEQLREDRLYRQIDALRSLPAGSSFTILTPGDPRVGVLDTITEPMYLTGERLAAMRMPRMPTQRPCTLDHQVKYRFMRPAEGLTDPVTTDLGKAVAEELGKALWTYRGSRSSNLIDTTLLAKLIRDELLIDPIEVVHYAVIDSTSNTIIHASPGVEIGRFDPGYQIPVFARDGTGLPWKLAIEYPNEQRSIMVAEMRWLLFLFLIVAGISLFMTQYMRGARERRRLADTRMELLSNISHEFNTPISNITLALETLKKAPSPSSRINNEQLWDIIHAENQRLQGTIRKVLDVSLFENEKISLMHEVHDIHVLLDATVDRFGLRSEQENVTMIKKFNARQSWAKVDATYLGHVFQSLIDNAIKYGGEGVIIMISTSDQENGLIVEFSDNGPGIAKEDRQRVFEKFYRARQQDRYAVQGTGIGLFHARQVIEAHGGSLHLKRMAGGGSTFEVLLPIEKQDNDQIARCGG